MTIHECVLVLFVIRSSETIDGKLTLQLLVHGSNKNCANVKALCFGLIGFLLTVYAFIIMNLLLCHSLQFLQLSQCLIVAAVVYLSGKSLWYVPDH